MFPIKTVPTVQQAIALSSLESFYSEIYAGRVVFLFKKKKEKLIATQWLVVLINLIQCKYLCYVNLLCDYHGTGKNCSYLL